MKRNKVEILFFDGTNWQHYGTSPMPFWANKKRTPALGGRSLTATANGSYGPVV